MKKWLLFIFIFSAKIALAQDTHTLPSGTTPVSPFSVRAFTSGLADSLWQPWISRSGGYSRLYTATELQKYYFPTFAKLSGGNYFTGSSTFNDGINSGTFLNIIGIGSTLGFYTNGTYHSIIDQGTATGNRTFHLPDSSGTFALSEYTLHKNNPTFTGALNGPAIYQNGNQVANNNAVVHNTGADTIHGIKTFTDQLNALTSIAMPGQAFVSNSSIAETRFYYPRPPGNDAGHALTYHADGSGLLTYGKYYNFGTPPAGNGIFRVLGTLQNYNQPINPYDAVNRRGLDSLLLKPAMVASFKATPPSPLLANPVISLSSVNISTTAPSFTGYTDQAFNTSFTANTTSGSNIIIVSSATGLTVGRPLIEQGATVVAPTTIPLGTVITAISGTTVTMSNPAMSTQTSLGMYAWSAKVNLIGGFPFRYGTAFTAGSSSVLSATPSVNTNAYAIEFLTDAANFSTSNAAFIISLYANGGSGYYRLAIDDHYQSAAPISYGASLAAFISVTLPTAGIHKIRLELQGGTILYHLYAINGASFIPPKPSQNIRVAMYSDSYFASGNTFAPNNLGFLIPTILGWTPDILSVGGTGYVNNGSVNYNFADTHRLDDVTHRNYDAVIIQGSVNDYGSSAATIRTNALTTFQGIRSRQPNATIFVFGCMTTTNLSAADAATIENAIKSAFDSWGDSNSYFIPITTDPNGGWITSSTTSIYMAGDGTHPSSQVGQLYLAQRYANSILNILKAQQVFVPYQIKSIDTAANYTWTGSHSFTTTTSTKSINIAGNITPGTTGYLLGSTSAPWFNIYGTNIISSKLITSSVNSKGAGILFANNNGSNSWANFFENGNFVLSNIPVDTGYRIQIRAHGTNGYFYAGPNVRIDTSGVLSTNTPAIGDNSTKVATTAYVNKNTNLPDTFISGTDANQTISTPFTWLTLPSITANRTITMPTGGNYTGRTVKIHNTYTSATYTWSFTGATVNDTMGNAISTLNTASLYILEFNGTNWIKIN